jgi:hypothetical protein
VRRSIRTTGTAVITILIASAYALAVGTAAAAENDKPAQTEAAAPASGDACSLLTNPDAAAALGEAVSGPKSMSGVSMGPGSEVSSCEYSGSGIHKVHLNLMRLAPDTAAMYRAMCAQKGKEGLAALGDVACWYNERHEELHVMRGTTLISIEMRRSGDPTEAIKGVMKKALDRLR